jgi:hypothetical protein
MFSQPCNRQWSASWPERKNRHSLTELYKMDTYGGIKTLQKQAKGNRGVSEV